MMFRRLIPVLVLFSVSAWAGDGVGTKNGGTGIMCPRYRYTPMMYEVEEISNELSGPIPPIPDRNEFFRRVFGRIRASKHPKRAEIERGIKLAMSFHGPVNTWPISEAPYITILYEDETIRISSRYVDWLTGRITLNNGCIVFPVSYISWLDPIYLRAQPTVVRDNLKLLDPFNQNVLELHEAVYKYYLTRRRANVSVAPTRALVRALIHPVFDPVTVQKAMDDFIETDWMSPPFLLNLLPRTVPVTQSPSGSS